MLDGYKFQIAFAKQLFSLSIVFINISMPSHRFSMSIAKQLFEYCKATNLNITKCKATNFFFRRIWPFFKLNGSGWYNSQNSQDSRFCMKVKDCLIWLNIIGVLFCQKKDNVIALNLKVQYFKANLSSSLAFRHVVPRGGRFTCWNF